LVNEGIVGEADIDRMARNIIKTYVAMGLLNRTVRDESYLNRFDEHNQIALQTAREGIILLKNDRNVLPAPPGKGKKILLTGDFVKELARGRGAAAVKGYNIVSMKDAFEKIYGNEVKYVKNPSDKQIELADIILVSIGTIDSEAWDRPNTFSEKVEQKILRIAKLNPNVVVIVNSGGGMNMTSWADKVAGIFYSWYVGQNGNIALAEIVSGKTNPSGKLPITIEKRFEDSPAFPSLPRDYKLYTGWRHDFTIKQPIIDIEYNEGVFVGYRWYDTKGIEPAFPFGYGLSYTSFEYSNLKLSKSEFAADDSIEVEFTLTNSGDVEGSEVAQLYIHHNNPSVPRPVKELKGFKKVNLKPGESQEVRLILKARDFSFWDADSKRWKAEPGKYKILIGSSSAHLKLQSEIVLK
jgi:beta-glucosidase